MSNTTYPNLITSALFFGSTAVFAYLQAHIGELGIPPIYAPIVGSLIALVLKLIGEWQKKILPTVEAQSAYRGLDGSIQPTIELEQDSYIARVLWK